MQRILRLPAVIERTGLSRSSIYSYQQDKRFPRSIPLGGRNVGWLESDIEKWIESKIMEQENAA